MKGRPSQKRSPRSKFINLGIIMAFVLAVFAIIAVVAMGDMIQEGDVVSVHYTGKLEDGTVFDSSEGRQPLEFEVGGGRVIAGFNDAVIGKRVGDEVTVSIAPKDAYGEVREEMIVNVSKSNLGNNTFEVGDTASFRDSGGNSRSGKVVGVSGEGIVVDFNHMLAGKTLVFDIKIVSKK